MLLTLFSPTAIFYKALISKENSLSITPNQYRKISKKLETDWNEDTTTNNGRVYSNSDIVVIRINATIGNIIFNALQKGLKIPDELGEIRFINVSETTAFAVVKSDTNKNITFPELIHLADLFRNMLYWEIPIYIDYVSLFSKDHNCWLSCIFNALTTTFQIQNSARIDSIVGQGLRKYNINYYSNICFDPDSFCQHLRNGVYFYDKDSCFNIRSSFPFELWINILRFRLNYDSFEDIHDLLEYDSFISDAKKLIELDNTPIAIIIDEEKFRTSLTKVSENDSFVIFKNRDNQFFAKINDELDSDEVVTQISSFQFKIGFTYVCSKNIGTYLHFEYAPLHRLQDTCNLANEEEFALLIQTIDQWGQENKQLEKIFFYNDANFLQVFLMCDHTRNPVLNSFTEIDFKPTTSDRSRPFSYKLLLCQVIKQYMLTNHISVSNIYSEQFIKILTPSFVQTLMKYLANGDFEITSGKSVLNGLSVCQVEFVENLTSKNWKADDFKRVSFFDDAVLPRGISNRFNQWRSKLISEGYLDMNAFLSPFTNRELSKDTIKCFFPYYNIKVPAVNLLLPEKVIISKDCLANGNYVILGIIWNFCKLKNGYETIKAKKLNNKEVYVFIESLLLDKFSITFHNAGITPLITAEHKNVFWEPSFNYKFYHYNSLPPSDYYKRIIDVLNQEADLSQNYTVFDWDELVPSIFYHLDHSAMLSIFSISVNEIRLCPFHDNWHTENAMCPICKKLFVVTNTDFVPYFSTPLYTNSSANFYNYETEDKDQYILYSPTIYSSRFTQEVRIGIENNLYDGFVGIRPQKLIKSQSSDKVYPHILLNSIDMEKLKPISSFSQINRLKVVLAMYKNILPRILDGTFICNSTQIFETIAMHKNYKDEILIPDLPLLACSTIMDKDSTLHQLAKKKTKEYFATFLLNYISDDTYLKKFITSNDPKFTAVIEDITSLTFTESIISDVLATFTGYCHTHKLPFSNFCPECASDGIKEEHIIFCDKDYFQALDPSRTNMRGGEATLYPYGEQYIQKIFEPHVNLAQKSKILAKAMEKAPLIDAFNAEHKDIKIISATKLLYMRNGNSITLKGYVQEFVKDAYKISNLKDKGFVKAHNYSRTDVVEILMNLCIGIEFLHSIGGYIGDLNGGNVLIQGTSVYIIDIDGMSFDEVKNCIYTEMYIYPPSAESKNITSDDDWYSLAIQAFYYLTHSHPFKGISNDPTIPNNEIERMKYHLSVLGNHNITPSGLSIGWDFLPDDLLKHFRLTFEANKRESMLSILRMYFTALKKSENMFQEVKRRRNVKAVINLDTYVDEDNYLVYQEVQQTRINGFIAIFDVGEGALVVFTENSLFFSYRDGKTHALANLFSNPALTVHNHNFYYAVNDKLFVDTLNLVTAEVESHRINKVSPYPIVDISVDEENKFVFVENNESTGKYDIYCNSVVVKSISKRLLPDDVRIQIVYDPISKKRLVLFKGDSKTTVVVIETRSENPIQFDIMQKLSDSVAFYGNILYYVGVGTILSYNVNSRKSSSIECDCAHRNSRIYRFDNKFVIVDGTKTFLYEKTDSQS